MIAVKKMNHSAFFPQAWPTPLPLRPNLRIPVKPVVDQGFADQAPPLRCQWQRSRDGKLHMEWRTTSVRTK